MLLSQSISNQLGQHTLHYVARFSDKSSLTVNACNMLVEMKRQNGRLVDVSKAKWGVMNDVSRLLDWRELNTSIEWSALAFELQKGVAHKNRNKLHGHTTDEQRDDCKRGLSSLNGQKLAFIIEEIASILKVTTTGLGVVVYGSIIRLREADDHVAQCFKKMNDRVEGCLIRGCKSHHFTNEIGRQGESAVEKALGEAGVQRDEYWTEEDQKVLQTEKGTPDILFKKLTAINGVEVKWIDAKNMLLIPGVSSGETVNNYDKKMDRYVTEHGPGAIVWAKTTYNKKSEQEHAVGFPENLRDRHEHVTHFTLTRIRGRGEWSGVDA